MKAAVLAQTVGSSMTSHLKCRSHCSRIDQYLNKRWYRHCDIWILHQYVLSLSDCAGITKSGMWLISDFFFFLIIWTSLSEGKQIYARVFFFLLLLLLFIFAPSLQLEDALHFRLLFSSLHVWTQILAVGNRPASSSSSVRNDCFRKLC